jgi:hypothetical protein
VFLEHPRMPPDHAILSAMIASRPKRAEAARLLM